MKDQEQHPEKVFERIAVAVAFSPRIEAILAEAKNLKSSFDAPMIFIHIGKHTLQDEQYLVHLLHRFHLDGDDCKVIWQESDARADAILSICEKEKVDLLVAGALEKESLIKYFMGSMARKLSRKAKCSILMLTEPSIKPNHFKRIVVEGADHEKTKNTIAVAIEWAKAYQAEELDIVQETDLSKLALMRSDDFKETEIASHIEKLNREEDEKLDYILSHNNCSGIKINTERIEGKPGYVISKFAREHSADLLVLNGPDRKLNLIDRVFPHDIEFALTNYLPCNVLIVHPKGEE